MLGKSAISLLNNSVGKYILVEDPLSHDNDISETFWKVITGCFLRITRFCLICLITEVWPFPYGDNCPWAPCDVCAHVMYCAALAPSVLMCFPGKAFLELQTGAKQFDCSVLSGFPLLDVFT